MNDDDLEIRLGRLRPAEPPRDLMRRLREAAPAPRWVRFWRQPWPLAYAALLTVWLLIGILRLMTPRGPEPAGATAIAPASTGTSAAERTFFLTRNFPTQP